ncbi:MAG: phosphotransferase [bacterium]|nr:phosphotransferase [bacterium]
MPKDIDLICKLNSEWLPSNIKVKKAGGQTNRNYIVQYKDKKFFVRLPWERAGVVNRKIEADNILALSRNKNLKNILPEYHVFILKGKNILQPKNKGSFDLPDGTMMTEYIEGKVFSSSLFKKKQHREKLASLFSVFHASGVIFKNKYNVFRNEVAKYRIEAKKYPLLQLIGREVILKLEKAEKEAGKNIPVLKKGVSTHNDFIFQNFLLGNNGKSYLLDFEYAGLNQKGGVLYDFGFLFADNLFRNPPISQELFEDFLCKADRIYKKKLDRDQIYWLSIAATLVMVWWGIIRYFSVKTKKEKTYFKNYVLKRVKGIEFIRTLSPIKRG